MSRNIILLHNSVSLSPPSARARRQCRRPASVPRCSMIVPAENLVSGPVGPTDRPRSRLSGRQEQGRNNPQDGLEVDASHCVSNEPPRQAKHFYRRADQGSRESELAPHPVNPDVHFPSSLQWLFFSQREIRTLERGEPSPLLPSTYLSTHQTS